MALFWLALAWLVGLGVAARMAPAPWGVAAAAIVAAVVAAWGWSAPGSRWLGLVVVAAALGGLRWATDQPGLATGGLTPWHGQTVAVQGWISEEPVELARHTRLTLMVESIAVVDANSGAAVGAGVSSRAASGATVTPIGGKVLAIVLNTAPRWYGDRLTLVGALTAPPVFDGFSYQEYLARQGIDSMLRFPQVRALPGQAGEPWRRALYEWKATWRDALERFVPEPQASLLVGVVLGSRSAMPTALLDAFNATNLTHLLAISGWNMTLIGGWVGGVIGAVVGARRFVGVVLIAVALTAYALLVGASASVARAVVMGTIGFFAAWSGRSPDVLPSLGVAALALTAWQPNLLWDVGFQLSFLATLGIALHANPIENWLAGDPAATGAAARWRLPTWLAAPLSVTIAAEAWTTPLLAVDFNRLSLIGLASNLTLAWTMGFIMVLGGLTAVVGAIGWLAPVATLLGWGAWLFSAILTTGVEWFAALPFASVEVGAVDSRVAWLWYAGLIGATLAADPTIAQRRKTWLDRARSQPVVTGLIIWSAGWLLFLFAAPSFTTVAPDRLHFMRLGAGDVVLARAGDDTTVLIDGGGSTTEATQALGRRLPFWARRLDLVALTAHEAERATGLTEVVRRYDVARTLLPSGDAALIAVRHLRDALTERGAPIITDADAVDLAVGPRGQVKARVLSGGAMVDSVAPPAGARTAPGRASDGGLTLRLDLPQLSLVSLANLSGDQQRELLATGAPLRADVLRLPARITLTPELFAAVAPRVVVFPEPPNRAAVANPLSLIPADWLIGVEVWPTGPAGTVEVISDGGRFETRRLR